MEKKGRSLKMEHERHFEKSRHVLASTAAASGFVGKKRTSPSKSEQTTCCKDIQDDNTASVF